jgi:hypothetical protein
LLVKFNKAYGPDGFHAQFVITGMQRIEIEGHALLTAVRKRLGQNGIDWR